MSVRTGKQRKKDNHRDKHWQSIQRVPESLNQHVAIFPIPNHKVIPRIETDVGNCGQFYLNISIPMGQIIPILRCTQQAILGLMQLNIYFT